MTLEDKKIFIKIPDIKTERVLLRRIVPKDIDDVYEYASDVLVPKYLLWYPHPDKDYTRMYLQYVDKKYKKGDFYDWGIEVEGKMIGTCGFTSFDIGNNSAEIGYVLNRRYWGLGIATECARAVIKFGFEALKLERICAKHMTGNDTSSQVMIRCHMTYEGTHKRAIIAKGDYKDISIYAITREDYEKLKKKKIFYT